MRPKWSLKMVLTHSSDISTRSVSSRTVNRQFCSTRSLICWLVAHQLMLMVVLDVPCLQHIPDPLLTFCTLHSCFPTLLKTINSLLAVYRRCYLKINTYVCRNLKTSNFPLFFANIYGFIKYILYLRHFNRSFLKQNWLFHSIKTIHISIKRRKKSFFRLVTSKWKILKKFPLFWQIPN